MSTDNRTAYAEVVSSKAFPCSGMVTCCPRKEHSCLPCSRWLTSSCRSSRRGLATGYGAVVTLENVAAGRYAIVLSRDARLDAAQHRPFQVLPVTGWTAGAGCLVVAEIRAEAGPLTLQVSGVATPTIMVAIVKLPDDGGYPGRARYQDRIVHPEFSEPEGRDRALSHKLHPVSDCCAGGRYATRKASREAGMEDAVGRERIVTVNDRMQRGYRYALTAPAGRNFDPGVQAAAHAGARCFGSACSAAST